VKATGGKWITLSQFLVATRMRNEDVFRHFPRWEDALHASGFNIRRPNARIETESLLEDWAAVTRDLQRIPTRNEYKVRGKFSARVVEARCGGWRHVPAAFRSFAKNAPQWTGIIPLLPAQTPCTARKPRRMLPGKSGTIGNQLRNTAASRLHARQGHPVPSAFIRRRRRFASSRNQRGLQPRADIPICGDRLPFGLFLHAPVNESGVVLLFGAMAGRLGFLIESVRRGFPDCDAKRQVGPNLWERVRIEFEYESRNFLHHKHSAEDCDLIVCWTHNWEDCPKNLGVIALKEELKSFGSRGESLYFASSRTARNAFSNVSAL
jgi:hypothetical protein